jgi:hypothetical protein
MLKHSVKCSELYVLLQSWKHQPSARCNTTCWTYIYFFKFLHMPGQAMTVPAGWWSQISRQLTHESGMVVNLMHRPLSLISVRGWDNPSAIMQPEGLFQWKIPVTAQGIKPATFWLVARCLNELCYRMAPDSYLVACYPDPQTFTRKWHFSNC